MLKTPVGSKLGTASCMLALVAALGLGGSLAGCADIHPEGDTMEEGMIDSPTDEAERFREHSAEETEHGDEGRRN